METSSLDIVSLVEKNPLIKLNKDYQNKFVEKIKSTFTETQQNLFVGSFYCYLNYNDTDFVIDLDDIWKWVGFSRKDHCKKMLERNFTNNIDYMINFAPATGGALIGENKIRGCAGKNKESIVMNIITFKKLCMKAGTKKADEIHDYFIKLEKTLQEVVNEESVELRNQLTIRENNLNIREKEIQKQIEEKNKTISLLENKPDTEGFFRTSGYIYLIKDDAKPGHYKIGMSIDPDRRIHGLNVGSSTNSMSIVGTYKTKDNALAEKIIHSTLFCHKIKKQKEWFYTTNENTLDFFIKTIKESIEFADKYAFDTTEEEIESLLCKVSKTKKEYVKMISRDVQTDIQAIQTINLEPENSDEVIFNKFLTDCCILDNLIYVPKRDLIYQYKTWSKINNIFNHENFEQYILSKFKTTRRLNETLNCDMLCISGINLKESFYNFGFSEPHSEIQEFLIETCVKLPTAKLNMSLAKESYRKWRKQKNKEEPDKTNLGRLMGFLDKHFFKNLTSDGSNTYHAWFGITTKENMLTGTGINSTLCKKNKVYQVYLDDPNNYNREWESQKDFGRDFGINASTVKNRIDAKYVFKDSDGRSYNLIRECDFKKFSTISEDEFNKLVKIYGNVST